MAVASKKTLKIAFIHNKYINYRIPFFETLAKYFDVDFFFDQFDYKTKIRKNSFTYKKLRSVAIANTPTYEIYLSPTLLFKLLKGKYDLFVGSGIGEFSTHIAFIVSRLTRKPFILWNETWYRPKTFLRSLTQIPVINLMLKSEAVVVSGSKAKEFAILNFADPENIFTAPNASDMITDGDVVPREQELKKELGIKNKKVILYLGRLIKRKGIEILIKAFYKLQPDINDSFLVVVGEGNERANLEKLCMKLKLDNVIFTGYVDDKDKRLYYSLADVFVLPSMKHSGEVWDLVLNEAMASAKPVVSTSAAGSSYDLVKNGVNGYMVEAGDENAIYEAIKTLLKDSEKAKKMGQESKKMIEEGFSTDHMVKGFIKAINYVTNSSHRK